jgi:hypothetical protein
MPSLRDLNSLWFPVPVVKTTGYKNVTPSGLKSRKADLYCLIYKEVENIFGCSEKDNNGQHQVHPCHPAYPEKFFVIGSVIDVVDDQEMPYFGGGITPSCCIIPNKSIISQSSAIFPPSKRLMQITIMAICLPVGGIPIRSPL